MKLIVIKDKVKDIIKSILNIEAIACITKGGVGNVIKFSGAKDVFVEIAFDTAAALNYVMDLIYQFAKEGSVDDVNTTDLTMCDTYADAEALLPSASTDDLVGVKAGGKLYKVAQETIYDATEQSFTEPTLAYGDKNEGGLIFYLLNPHYAILQGGSLSLFNQHWVTPEQETDAEHLTTLSDKWLYYIESIDQWKMFDSATQTFVEVDSTCTDLRTKVAINAQTDDYTKCAFIEYNDDCSDVLFSNVFNKSDMVLCDYFSNPDDYKSSEYVGKKIAYLGKVYTITSSTEKSLIEQTPDADIIYSDDSDLYANKNGEWINEDLLADEGFTVPSTDPNYNKDILVL